MTATTTPDVSRVQAWLLAARPKTLPAAVVPVLVGGACAYRVGGFDPTTTMLCLLCALLLQITSNFANDVFDFEQGADTNERVGPARAVASGWISAVHMRRAMWMSVTLACAVGMCLIIKGGLIFVLLGLLSVVCAIAYTGGPYPLGYHGLGDVCVFAFFGLVAVCGTTYLNAGFLMPTAWFGGVAIGCLSTAILVVNNIRDVETDSRSGKRTLAVRWGRNAGVIEYALLLGVAYAVPIALWLSRSVGPLILLPLVTSPFALKRVIEVYSARNQALNRTLVNTAKLLLSFGVLMTVGLASG
jgi:1,4-dihydroxy-2-naphthoate polyprenyltransferase